MAVEKNIKINVDAEDAIKQVDELNHGVTSTDEAAAGSKHGFAVMKESVLGVSLAFKAMGIGLIVSAFVTLKDMLGQNQVVMDKLSGVGETVGFVFQKIINIVVELGTKMTKAFSDPTTAIAGLWTSIKQNLVDRLNGLIDTFGALGTVIKGVFTQDLDLMKEGLADAKTAMIQLATGMTEVEQTGFADNLKESIKQLKTVAKEATAYGKAITKLRNEVKLAEADQRQLQLAYQRDAELQRQIRDDISLTFEERITANEELGRVLDEQFTKEQELALKKIKLAQTELDQNKTNIDLQVALKNAKTDMLELEERITSQRSEQLTNLNALEKEYQDSLKVTEKVVKKTAEAEVKITKLTQEQKAGIISTSLGQIAGALGESSKAGKAMAIAGALIDTFSAANTALKQGGIFGAIAAAGIVASGLANVARIKAIDPEGGGGGGGTPDTSVPELSGLTGNLIPNMSAITPPELGEPAPVQAYVVENDISNAQALQDELEIQSTL